MEESEGQDRETGTALETYQELEKKVLEEFPELVEDTFIEKSPGDTPRNLRIFLPDGFMGVFVSEGLYSFHWEKEGVVRFDNSPHHNDLETFPDHLHLEDQVLESPLTGEDVQEKLVEALEYIQEKFY